MSVMELLKSDPRTTDMNNKMHITLLNTEWAFNEALKLGNEQ